MRSALLLALGIGFGCSANGNRSVDGGLVDTPVPTDGPTSDGAFAIDASPPDAFVPPPPATCGAPQAMPDDFGGLADPYPESGWSDVHAFPSGDTVTLRGSASTAYEHARSSVSLVSAAATVDVQTAIGSAGTMSFAAAWMDGSGYDRVGFAANGSDLEVGSWSVDGSSSTMTVAFDGSAMAFWQIRESAGTIAFATSPDGSAWSAPIYTVPTPPWAAYARLMLDAAGSATYTTTFAALDGSDAGSAMPWCNVDTFHSVPGSDNIPTWWSNTLVSDGCTFGGSGYIAGTGCGFGTSSRYDLVDSSILIHWGSDTEAAALPTVAISGSGLDADVFENETGELCDTFTSNCIAHAFDAAGADAYWQITEFSATHELELAISPDGITWMPMLLYPEPFVPSGIAILVGLVGSGTGRVLGVN